MFTCFYDQILYIRNLFQFPTESEERRIEKQSVYRKKNKSSKNVSIIIQSDLASYASNVIMIYSAGFSCNLSFQKPFLIIEN